MAPDINTNRNLALQLSSYISDRNKASFSEEVTSKAKYHILDTIAAAVSGSRLKSGSVARNFIRSQPDAKEAQVIGSSLVTSSLNAALVNGVMAHADETDDFIPGPNIHPGAAVIPAALALSEREGSDGKVFLNAVIVGYDIGCRILQSINSEALRQGGRCSQSFGGCFGAAAAAAVILGLSTSEVNYVLSYAAQQAAGLMYWPRDKEHIEKGFLFGGMPARDGLTAALLVSSGFTGVDDPFSGEGNLFECTSTDAKPELLVEELGKRQSIMLAYLKKFSVGGPAQSPLQALLQIISNHQLEAAHVEKIVAYLPGTWVVTDRTMPDIDLRYLLAVTLLDKGLSFEASHSFERREDAATSKLMSRIELVDSPELQTPRHKRPGIVEVTTRDGSKFREHVSSPPGSPDNPMTREELESKCCDLLMPTLGESLTGKLIETIWNIEQVKNVRELRPLISEPVNSGGGLDKRLSWV